MQGMGVMGLAFALLGAATFARLERLTKELKPKGILDEDNKYVWDRSQLRGMADGSRTPDLAWGKTPKISIA